MDFEIFCSAVILAEGPTLDASRALLRHKDFHGVRQKCDCRTKIPKIEKYNDWVGGPSGSLRMSFEVII